MDNIRTECIASRRDVGELEDKVLGRVVCWIISYHDGFLSAGSFCGRAFERECRKVDHYVRIPIFVVFILGISTSIFAEFHSTGTAVPSVQEMGDFLVT